MLRITLGSVRILLGVAAAGLVLWGGWKLGTYLVKKAVSEEQYPLGRGVDCPVRAKGAVDLWQRKFCKFSPISGG